MKKVFKIGDIIVRRTYGNNPIGTYKVKALKDVETCHGKYDMVVEHFGKDSYAKKSDFYLPDKRTIDIHGQDKWNVNKLLTEGNKVDGDGYFGKYTLVTYQGKQAIVYCDNRDANVWVITDWYDKIFWKGNAWNPDNRWNCDKPLVVYKKNKGYNFSIIHGCGELCNEWLKSVGNKWEYSKISGEYFTGVDKNGNEVHISINGTIKPIKSVSEEVLLQELNKAKALPLNKIQTDWIDKDKPCMHITGFQYKGANMGKINQEMARKLIKNHNNFNSPFESAEWAIHNGEVVLVFHDYCDSDYD